MTDFTPEQIEAAGDAYRTLKDVESVAAALPLPSESLEPLFDALNDHHKALNKARRRFSANMPFADFLDLISEPLARDGEPEDPESGGTNDKDEDDDEVGGWSN